jgi:hypothetical protein
VNLITVPACEDCNGGASPDDEWFRLALSIRENVKGNPARDAIVPVVERSMMKSAAPGFAQGVQANIHHVPRFTESGIFVGDRPVIAADRERLQRVAIRITKGLFYHEKGHRLPDGFHVNAIQHDLWWHPMWVGTGLEGVIPEFVGMLRRDAPEHKMGDAFSYRWLQSPNGADQTIWLLSFYGHDEFYCSTAPNDDGSTLIVL